MCSVNARYNGNNNDDEVFSRLTQDYRNILSKRV